MNQPDQKAKNKESSKESLNVRLQNFFTTLRNTPQAFRLVWKASRSTALVSFLLVPVSAVLPAGQAWVGKLIVDIVVNQANQSVEIGEGIRTVGLYIALEFVLIMLGSLFRNARSLFDGITRSKLTNYINSLVIQKAIELDLQYFEDPIFYNLMQNARRQADMSALSIVNSILQMGQQVISFFSLMVLLIGYSLWLPLIVVISAIPSFFSLSEFAQRSFRALTRRAPESRLLNYLESLLTGNEYVKEIKLFGLGDELLARYQTLFNKSYIEDRAIAEKRTLASFLWGLLSTLVYYASYIWIILKTISSQITLGDMTMFLSIFKQSQGAVQSLLGGFSSLYESNLYLDNLLDFLLLKPVIKRTKDGLVVPKKIQHGIELENISFCYPGSEQLVLKDVSMRIMPGERIALVGLNGAGKTTLIKLLTRLYDPTEGRILIDGVDLKDYDLKSLHQRFGVIFQDFVRYQFTVSENIGFGQIDALNDLGRIKDAAVRGGAEEMIEALPEGYNTMLGRRWENGEELSGGQWQKIALARAFMREAEILILDEPTSALDAEAEYEVFKRFNELVEDRIAVLISHRFSTVRMADRIAVLSGGHLAELGSHEELMNQNGMYARLFNLQAEGYRL